MVLRYTGTHHVAPVQNTSVDNVVLYSSSGLKLASCYDPDESVSGVWQNKQPLYWDTFSALYSKYRVNRVDYKLHWYVDFENNQTISSVGEIRFGVFFETPLRNVAPGAWNPGLASGDIKHSIVLNRENPKRTVKGTVYMRNYLRKEQFEENWSTMGSNPLHEIIMLPLYAPDYNTDASYAAPQIKCVVELKQHVTFFNPLTVQTFD